MDRSAPALPEDKTLPAMKSLADQRIVFFDGVCNLCNTSVDLLLRMDRRQKLLFAPLQGPTASSLLAEHYVQELNSIVFFKQGQVFEKSSAVLHIMLVLGGLYKIAWLGFLIPGFLRDPLYAWIARNRYRWFGEKSTCRLPTPAERARFLD